MTASNMSSSWSVVSGGVFCRFISPWVRNTGGSPTRKCRSDEADCTSALSSSPSARSAPLNCGAAKSAGMPADASPRESFAPGASTMGAAAITDGFGGRGEGAAGARASRWAGARWVAGAEPAAACAGVTVGFPIGATIAVSRPPSGTMRTRTMPRSAMYSNSVSVI